MKKKKNLIKFGLLGFLLLFTVVFAETLDNDVKVKPNSELTYYLNIDYDGIDENATISSDTATANVKSGFIEVTDKLPEGLTYKGVVEPVDEEGNPVNLIGAVKRSDGSICSGYVVDGVDGITYDEETRIVSFKVKNLGAGCRLTVGIITQTPTVDDPNTTIVETRRDFYNAFNAVEDSLSLISNQVHVFIGDEEATTYNVKYEYTGDVPDNAPNLPSDIKYASGTTVGVNGDVNITGYKFSGWSTSDVIVNDNAFVMPSNDVTFIGSFEEIPKYQVTYEIDGDYPSSYILPATEQYYEGNSVDLDVLTEDDIVDGYKFLGWETNDVDINDNSFLMPNKNVKITGKFERISYKVSYAFQGAAIPDNSNSLLPSVKEYYPGDKVKLEYPPDVDGYKFLGWYKKDNFTMPENDILIYGEWMIVSGLFEPSIKIDIINKQDKYIVGDIVKFKITVTNNENYDLNTVMIKISNEDSIFTKGDGYEISSKYIATIPVLKAKESIILYSEYKVTDESKDEEIQETEIVGALASNHYMLNTDKEYKDSVKYNIEHPIVEEIIENVMEEIKDEEIIESEKEIKVSNTGASISKYLIPSVIVIIILGISIFGFSYIKSQKERNNSSR